MKRGWVGHGLHALRALWKINFDSCDHIVINFSFSRYAWKQVCEYLKIYTIWDYPICRKVSKTGTRKNVSSNYCLYLLVGLYGLREKISFVKILFQTWASVLWMVLVFLNIIMVFLTSRAKIFIFSFFQYFFGCWFFLWSLSKSWVGMWYDP